MTLPLTGSAAAAAPQVPLSILGVLGVRVDQAQGQFLLSAITQAAAAILALVLTANILFTQLQPYALPVRFLVLWDRGTKLTYALLAIASLAPAVLILLAWYQFSDVMVALFAASLVVLGWYIRSRPRSVSLDRFFDEMVTHPELRVESGRELYHMALTALDRHDVDTFRKACLLLFASDGSDAVYQFWNTTIERVQDEPEAVTPLAEALYTCASPLAVTYAMDAAGRRAAGTSVPNPLFSPALADQSPHYLGRLLLLSGDRSYGALVRQEVLENLLLLALDLLTSCALDELAALPIANDVVPTLLGYLDEAEDELLLRIMRGDTVYHYVLFSLPGDERFGAAERAELEAARRRTWDRIASLVYYDHEWGGRPEIELALWREGGDELESVRGRENVEEVLGPRGATGLRCEWHPPRARRRWLTPRR